jgi:hypothetical protein
MAQSFSFSVILEPQECGGSTVLVPVLPEVVTEGDTEEEALVNARRRQFAPSSTTGESTGSRSPQMPNRRFAE